MRPRKSMTELFINNEISNFSKDLSGESFTESCLLLNEFKDRDFIWSAWSAPSNIALTKYWGKKANQLPQNPSVSLTLDYCRTNLMLICSPKLEEENTLSFYFHGIKKTKFGSKAFKLIKKIALDFPILNDYDIQILSNNTFPHSSGIASSASSMASLSLCLNHLIFKIKKYDFDKDKFFQQASHYARLGSGSACRSIFKHVALWGSLDSVSGSSDQFAIEIKKFHKIFSSFHDSVLIVSSEEKSVSSSDGHTLMDKHPYRDERYKNARLNCSKLLGLMEKDQLWDWGELVEREALELHGLMMNGVNSFILMKPNTLRIIDRVRQFRLKRKIPVFFTLDAGPNVHLLYPNEFKNDVVEFIKGDLLQYLENSVWYDDRVGAGPHFLGEGQQC